MSQKDRSISMERSALLVIDVQDSFRAGARWARRSTPDFEENVSRLIEMFRAAGRPVFYFLHSDEDEHFNVASPHYKLMDFLKPRPDEPILHKTTRNCFTSTQLVPLLLERDVRRIVVTGIQTEQCCETTTRVGADLGFDMDFVTEATMTFPIPKTLDSASEELPVEAILERTEYALRRRFARIATVEDIVRAFALSRAA